LRQRSSRKPLSSWISSLIKFIRRFGVCRGRWNIRACRKTFRKWPRALLMGLIREAYNGQGFYMSFKSGFQEKIYDYWLLKFKLLNHLTTVLISCQPLTRQGCCFLHCWLLKPPTSPFSSQYLDLN
jgi:hypothetical protein